MNLKILPLEIENIILDYINQLISKYKMDKVLVEFTNTFDRREGISLDKSNYTIRSGWGYNIKKTYTSMGFCYQCGNYYGYFVYFDKKNNRYGNKMC